MEIASPRICEFASDLHHIISVGKLLRLVKICPWRNSGAVFSPQF
jgi:hypothetical protein